jgi:hypothetical protein
MNDQNDKLKDQNVQDRQNWRPNPDLQKIHLVKIFLFGANKYNLDE